jgi:hypothetical protein
MTKITDKAIREFYGHNGVECRVRISRDGDVTRYGSPVPTDRSKDYWMTLGTRADAIREMAR